MKEVYVSYEIAKLLKEKGFDWDCEHYYKPNGEIVRTLHTESSRHINSSVLYEHQCLAPTQQMACKWLIETHNIHIEPHFLRASGDYVYDIIHSPLELDDIHSFPTVFNTKEDAVEAALQYCLTNLI